MYYLYLALCADDSIYTGITTDVARRLKEHQSGVGGRYTRAKKVLKILYTEKHKTRSLASRRESQVKKWTRLKKLELVKNGNDYDTQSLDTEASRPNVRRLKNGQKLKS